MTGQRVDTRVDCVQEDDARSPANSHVPWHRGGITILNGSVREGKLVDVNETTLVTSARFILRIIRNVVAKRCYDSLNSSLLEAASTLLQSKCAFEREIMILYYCETWKCDSNIDIEIIKIYFPTSALKRLDVTMLNEIIRRLEIFIFLTDGVLVSHAFSRFNLNYIIVQSLQVSTRKR